MAAGLALLGLVAAAAAPPLPALGSEGPVLRRAEVAAMTPEALTRKLFGDMAAMLYPVPHRISDVGPGHRTTWLGSLEFLTRPRRASRAGLCETDALKLELELALPRILAIRLSDQAAPTGQSTGPASPAPAGSEPRRNLLDDWPLQPRRITLHTQYFVHDLALARRNAPPDEEERADLEHACATLDPRDKPAIYASSGDEAGSGVEQLSRVIQAARAGRLPAPAECLDNRDARLTDEDCLKRLRHLESDALMGVQMIAQCVATRPELYCLRLNLRWETTLLLEMAPGQEAPVRIRLEPEPNLDEII